MWPFVLIPTQITSAYESADFKLVPYFFGLCRGSILILIHGISTAFQKLAMLITAYAKILNDVISSSSKNP